jgi:dienelactone hydrolase
MTAVEDFKTRMTEAGVVHRVITYPNAKHSFTNPTAGKTAEKFDLTVGYNRDADEASWAELTEFLRQLFGQEG